MVTRSDIIVHRADGKWARIYCNWDGSLSHNGKILFDHYTTQKKAEALVALGDLSSLGAEIGEKVDFEFKGLAHNKDGELTQEFVQFMDRRKAQCVSYARDRGYPQPAAQVGDSISDVWPKKRGFTKFTYVWEECVGGTGPCWFVTIPALGPLGLVCLGVALAAKSFVLAGCPPISTDG